MCMYKCVHISYSLNSYAFEAYLYISTYYGSILLGIYSVHFRVSIRLEHNILQSLPIILFRNSQKLSLQFVPIILRFLPVLLILRKQKQANTSGLSVLLNALHGSPFYCREENV